MPAPAPPSRSIRRAGPVSLSALLWLALAVWPPLSFGAGTLTLDEYFSAALRRSEVVATQSELIRQAEERARQATGALYPTVSGHASYTWQDPAPPDVTITSSTASRQPLAKLTATQPLFRGFREFAAIRQQEKLLGAQNEDYRHARLLLYRDVVQNFYEVLALEQDLANYQAEIDQNLAREKDIRARVGIGRSRASELLNVQATVSTLRATVEQLRGQWRVAREGFAFLSGLPGDTPLNDTAAPPGPLAALESYLAAVDSRPDVLAAVRRHAASRENVEVVQGEHLPSLDLNGNYYFDRPANLKDITWDVQIALTVPLFSGGIVQSKVREALSQRTQAELTLSQITRQAEQEIRALYQSVVHDLSQVAALERATEATRRSWEAQAAEYRLGLVTNLEVLQALTAYQQNQRALDRARYTARADYLRLLAACARPERAEPR